MNPNEYEHIAALVRGLHGDVRDRGEGGEGGGEGSDRGGGDATEHRITESTQLLRPTFNLRPLFMGRRASQDSVVSNQPPSPTPSGTFLNVRLGRHSISSFQIPSLIVTGADHEHSPHKRFSFGLRRHSHASTVFCATFSQLLSLTSCCVCAVLPNVQYNSKSGCRC